MFTPQEMREIKRYDPDTLKRTGKNTVSFMWSPTGGLFAGYPMDYDPTRPDYKLAPGHKFRPNHAEVMMMDPNFDEKFFKGSPDFLSAIAREPNKARTLVDKYGLSGRFGEIIVDKNTHKMLAFWPSENFDKYSKQVIKDCVQEFKLQPEDIVYCWKSEPTTIQEALGGEKAKSDDCMTRFASFRLSNGQVADVGDILSALHMVKGPELEKIKGSFCDQYMAIKKQCLKNGCEHLIPLLDDCFQKLQCGGYSYNTRLKAGALITQDELRRRLDPSNIGLYYHNKGEVDQAWDAYQQLKLNRREAVSFRMYFDKISLLERFQTCPCKK